MLQVELHNIIRFCQRGIQIQCLGVLKNGMHSILVKLIFFCFVLYYYFFSLKSSIHISPQSDISPKSGVVAVHPIFYVILKSLSDQNYVLVNIL
jgi:hypothetical protein